jgi:FixJ family two-component response regulator
MYLNGFEVRAYATGAAFLKELSVQDDVECVVCEAQLPDTTGISIYEALHEHNPEIRFALLLSERSPLQFKAARDAGISQVFSKPLVNRHLLTFVNNLQ